MNSLYTFVVRVNESSDDFSPLNEDIDKEEDIKRICHDEEMPLRKKMVEIENYDLFSPDNKEWLELKELLSMV